MHVFAGLSSYFRRFFTNCSSLESGCPIGRAKSTLNRFIPHGAAVYSTDLRSPSRALPPLPARHAYLIVWVTLNLPAPWNTLVVKGLETSVEGCLFLSADPGLMWLPGRWFPYSRSVPCYRFSLTKFHDGSYRLSTKAWSAFPVSAGARSCVTFSSSPSPSDGCPPIPARFWLLATICKRVTIC
jgi:hypothetical protein